MCGIGGRSSRGPMARGQAEALAERMDEALRHRGPDGSGFHHDADTLLVHRRLAIIDLSEAGLQPIWNEDRTICVIVNGEIYNFQDLRRRLEARGHGFRSRSDSETIVHLYEDAGIAECCRALQGMFAFALWDSRKRDLYLVRDRLGIKPLVVAEHAEGVTFASLTAGLLADPAVSSELRPDAIAAVMKWGFVPTPWSAIRDARHLLPGSLMHVREGVIVGEQQWWTDLPPDHVTSEEEMRAVFERAIESHLVADVPVGVLLSSGVDSGIVSALGARLATDGGMEAWTASQPGFPEDEFEDAARTAEWLGLRLHEVPVGTTGATPELLDAVVRGMDEPLPISSLVGLHALFRAIARSRRVVLSGDGGDELFAGYEWHAGMPQVPWWARTRAFAAIAPELARRRLPGRAAQLSAAANFVRRHPASVYLDKLRIASDAVLGGMGIALGEMDPMEARAIDAWDRFNSAGQVEQMLAVDRATALVDEMLAKVDTASMASAVEVRVPFLADPVVGAAKGLLSTQKRGGQFGKVMLRRWFSELGPTGADTRPKRGFNSPVAAWFQGPAADFLRDYSALGAELLGVRTVPTDPRLAFSAAILGAWSDRLSAVDRVSR